MSRETKSDYYDNVKSIVDDAFKEFDINTLEDLEDHQEDLDQYINESVDGSGWIIYYSAAQQVLEFSDNVDAYLDAGIDINTSNGFLDICQQCAYWAMETDVREALEEAKEDLPTQDDLDEELEEEEGEEDHS